MFLRMNNDLQIALFTIISVWLFVVSGFLVWIIKYFRNISKDVKRGNLVNVLDKVLEIERKNSNEIKRIHKEIDRIDNEKISHIQKIGLVRFNPFDELGGDHSFVLTLLNQKDSGVLITGLHTRERTRIYIKDINNGKAVRELSTEEKKSLREAIEGKSK